MEKNNWKKIAKKQYNKIVWINEEDGLQWNTEDTIIRAMLEFGNLVFEATKKECADNAKTGQFTNQGSEILTDKDSILNIEKPNL